MKNIKLDYDGVNELAMMLTDEILNVFENDKKEDHIKIYKDEVGYCWDLQDLILEKLLKQLKVKDENYVSLGEFKATMGTDRPTINKGE